MYKLLLASITVLILFGCVTSPPIDPVVAAAESGDAMAMHHLCYGYIYGLEGYPKDYKQALLWCKKGAETGNPNDETLYAELYFNGEGVKKDDAIAEKWYKRAAEQNHPHAELMLAVLAINKENPNIEVFCYWLERSMSQQYDKAENYYNHMNDAWLRTHPDKKPLCAETDISVNAEPH